MAVQYSSSILASIFTIFRERAPSSIATGPLTLCMADHTLLLTINQHLNVKQGLTDLQFGCWLAKFLKTGHQ